MKEFRIYQAEAVKYGLELKRSLIADDMGMGKCAIGIGIKKGIENVKNYDVPALIVSPASVVHHWEDEIKEWYKKGNQTKVAKIRTSTYDSDINEAKGSDFVIIGYPTLSYFGKDKDKINRLKEFGFQYGIIDEVHNAKNPESTRSMVVRDLFHSMEYLALLSGTPIPNTIIDIYSTLNLLDKEAFPINSNNPKVMLNNFYQLFRQDPLFVKDMIDKHKVGGTSRKSEDFLHKEKPKIITHNLEIKLTDEHRDVYNYIYENYNIGPGNKLGQLRAVALDPNLANSKFLNDKLAKRIGSMESSVYNELDNKIEEIIDNNGKILVFSDLREGVTDYLRGRWNKFKPLIIDGNKSRKIDGYDSKQDIEKREFIRRKFQRDPDNKMLITTTVMDEGVDLTAATDIIHLRLPYTPSAFHQRNSRSSRIGEIKKNKVNVYKVKTTLNNLFTVDEGIEKALYDKERIISFLEKSPDLLTKRDLEEIKNGHLEKSKYIPIYLRQPLVELNQRKKEIKNKGFFRISELYKNNPEIAEQFALLYSEYWEGYYGGNTANLYGKIIDILKKHEEISKKVDIASGPFSLSRKIKEPVTNIDINHYMLKSGKILEEKGRIVSGNTAIQGMFHKLPLASNSFDMAMCSLALHNTKLEVNYNGKEIKEREGAFRELNRVLKIEGIGLITLPHSVLKEKNLGIFYNGLEKLGFEVLPFSGFYKGPKDANFKVYLGALKKINNPCKDILDDYYLKWEIDKETIGDKTICSTKKGKKNHFKPKPKKEEKKEIVGQFFNSRSRKSLEDSILEGLV